MGPTLLERLVKSEAAGGVLLISATIAALLVANSSYEVWYHAALDAPLAITLGGSGLVKPLILWINDGLMAIFFFLIGLELKREVLEGKLRRLSDIVLPGAAAIGGMIAPALIYLAVNAGNPEALRGWAIPTATDIAFALGVLALVGRGLPVGLKTFLLTLAILDDLGAILIIAFFYSSGLFPGWNGQAIIAALGSQGLVRVAIDGDKAREIERIALGKRIREVKQGADGAIWILEDGKGGRLRKLTPG